MEFLAIVYVTDMKRSVDFYRTLLPEATVVHGSPYWTELDVAGSRLALHHLEELPNPPLRVELALVTTKPLDAVANELGAAGVEIRRHIADEAFGRSMVVADPDGLPIQINEHQPDVYPDNGEG